MSTDKIADLKAKFVTGAIPLESDYATLLNMLEETRVATGTSPDAPKSTSLRLTSNGSLDVAVDADGGVLTGASGISIDAWMLWPRNHAVATGASQYGMWSGGFVFIYILPESGKRMLQSCMIKGELRMNDTFRLKLTNSIGTVVVDDGGNGSYEKIEGWTDRLGSTTNTWHFNSTTTEYSALKGVYWIDVAATKVLGVIDIPLVSV